MQRVVTASPLAQLASADFNEIQDLAVEYADLEGGWIQPPDMVQSTDSTHVEIGPFAAVVGGERFAVTSPVTVTIPVDAGTLKCLALRNTAGVLSYEILAYDTSTRSALLAGGDLYVCLLARNAGGGLLGFVKNGRHVHYVTVNAALEIVSGSTSVGTFTPSVAFVVPVHARHAIVWAQLTPNTSPFGLSSLFMQGRLALSIAAASLAGLSASGEFHTATDGGNLQYQLTSAGTDVILTIRVVGYIDLA